MIRKLTSIEVFRKLIHLFSLIYPILYIILDSRKAILIIVGILLAILLIVDVMRLKLQRINHLFHKYFGFALRSKEYSSFTGSTFFMLGTFFTIFFYSKDIAILSLFVLIISDTFAAIIGLYFGKIKIYTFSYTRLVILIFNVLIIKNKH